MKKIYFVRHGQTEGNVGDFYQFSNTPLTEAGERGADALAARFRNVPIDIVIASPFLRTQQTATPIAEILKLPIVTYEDFHEIDQATAMRGIGIHSEAGAQYDIEYKAQFTNPNWNLEGAENYNAVMKRVENCVAYLEGLTQENILVVSHGTLLQFLCAYLLYNKVNETNAIMTLRKSVFCMSNVGVTEFVIVDGRWRLFTWNDHAHFAE